MITPDIERDLYRCLEREARELECKVLAINGIENHVHIVVEFPPTLALSHLLKQLKGNSSRMANAELIENGEFKWRGSYAALTISRWDVSKVVAYVKNQEEHHAIGSVKRQFEPEEEFLILDED